jgi:hypothetical protein
MALKEQQQRITLLASGFLFCSFHLGTVTFCFSFYLFVLKKAVSHTYMSVLEAMSTIPPNGLETININLLLLGRRENKLPPLVSPACIVTARRGLVEHYGGKGGNYIQS